MGRYARNSIGKYAPVGAAADDLPGGATPTGKKTIDTTAEVDVASYATAQVVDENLAAANIKKDVEVLGILGEFEGGGGGIPTPTITATFVCSDYANIDNLASFIVQEINGEYQSVVLTELATESVEITGFLVPSIARDNSVIYSCYPYCSSEENEYTCTVSNLVNCTTIDGEGVDAVIDISQPCSATFTFTNPST